jgi:sigma-B regulation protein RsbU (phosphoserine phosphatase)
MPKRARFLYLVLAVLFLISVTYRIRETSDRFELLLNPQEHARDPFRIELPGKQITRVQPEGEAVGIQNEDTLLAFAGRSFSGAIDFVTPMRAARAGDRVDVKTRSTAGTLRDASIQLQPYGPPTETAVLLQQVVYNVMPLFCLFLGAWVAAVRISDIRAWIFFVMMVSVAEINSGFVRTWLGHEDFFQPIGVAYQLFASNILGASLLFFGIYFPERLHLDRRFLGSSGCSLHRYFCAPRKLPPTSSW